MSERVRTMGYRSSLTPQRGFLPVLLAVKANVLPWPDPFPDFRGVIVLRDERGEGTTVELVDQFGMEFHPDTNTYPNVARCFYTQTVDSVSEDASAEKKARLKKQHTIRLYFKVLHALASCDVYSV